MAIQKSGAVVVSAKDPQRILLLYRAKYKDWSFPKGHIDPGENAMQAMHREVREETGLTVRELCQLAPLRYVDGTGRESFLEMWLTRSLNDTALVKEHPGDRLVWEPLDKAAARLTHDSLLKWYNTQQGVIALHIRQSEMRDRA